MDIRGMSPYQIIVALTPLVEAGRLSGQIYVDDVLMLDSEANNAVDPPEAGEYDQYGFSAHDEYGCVRIQGVDIRIAEWLENGDDFQRQVAQSQPQWYGIPIKGRQYDPEVERNLYKNIENWFALGIIGSNALRIEKFYSLNPRFVNRNTGEVKDDLTNAEWKSKEWGHNPDYFGAVVPNHATVARGNWSNVEHELWETKVANAVADVVLHEMDQTVSALKRRAADKAAGNIRPGFDR